MITETPIRAKRRVRDAEIKKLFQEYMAVPGSMKSATADRIAREMEVSIATVHRVIK